MGCASIVPGTTTGEAGVAGAGAGDGVTGFVLLASLSFAGWQDEAASASAHDAVIDKRLRFQGITNLPEPDSRANRSFDKSAAKLKKISDYGSLVNDL